MNTKEKEDHRRLIVENARKQLKEGTWPQVMAVFGYCNPKAPRASDEEFARLKALYEDAGCKNMAAFAELVQFQEKEHGVTMSFNLSMRRRLTGGEEQTPTMENTMLLFSCPDVLVGTRQGIEGAAIWFRNFSEVMPNLAPELHQIMDKIFGEALDFLKGSSHTVTVQEMLNSAIFGEGDILKPRDVSQH